MIRKEEEAFESGSDETFTTHTVTARPVLFSVDGGRSDISPAGSGNSDNGNAGKTGETTVSGGEGGTDAKLGEERGIT